MQPGRGVKKPTPGETLLARLQRALVLLVLGTALAWWLASGVMQWGLAARVAVLMVLLLPHAWILGLEFVLLWIRTSPPSRPAIRSVLIAWWREVWTGVRVFGWRQPFASDAVPDHLVPSQHAGRRGVILVHGFVCNRGLWSPWLRRLRQLDVPCIAVNLEPVFGSIDDYPPIIDAAVTRMTEQTGLAPVIVAHSMGGLATRAWLRSHGSVSRFHQVVTIASPHHGTWLARFALTANGRQMRLASRWVSDLAAVEPSEIRGRFTCFHGSCDNIVFPVGTATLLGADNRHLPGVAHVDMVSVPGVFDEVLRRVEE